MTDTLTPIQRRAAVTERRTAARQARDAFPPMGIYAVRDLRTGEVRLGASRNVPGVLNRIQFELRLGTHPDRALQAAWRDGGSERLRFDTVELLHQRSAPDFDYATELQDLLAVHRALRAEADAAAGLTPGKEPT